MVILLEHSENYLSLEFSLMCYFWQNIGGYGGQIFSFYHRVLIISFCCPKRRNYPVIIRDTLITKEKESCDRGSLFFFLTFITKTAGLSLYHEQSESFPFFPHHLSFWNNFAIIGSMALEGSIWYWECLEFSELFYKLETGLTSCRECWNCSLDPQMYQ